MTQNEVIERAVYRALIDKAIKAIRVNVVVEPETPLENLFPTKGLQHILVVDELCAFFGKEYLPVETVRSQRTVGDILKYFTNGSKVEGAQEEILFVVNKR